MTQISPTTADTVIGLETIPPWDLPSTLAVLPETRQEHYSPPEGEGATASVAPPLWRGAAPSLSKIKQLISGPPLNGHRARSYAQI